MKLILRLIAVRAFAKLREIRPEFSNELRLICAVSGGKDSASLITLMSELAEELQLRPIVVHIDHGIRENSGRDSEFVRSLAANLEMQFFSMKLPAPPPGENLEAWLRLKRYEFLEHIRLEQRGDLIVTAHHRNDQVETLLMQLLTNRLSKTAEIGINALDMRRKIFRPLLDATRADIDAYAADRGIKWVEDETNCDPRFFRNLMRNEIIPLLKKRVNPSLDEAILSFAQRLTWDEEYISRDMPQLGEFLLEVSAAAHPALNLRKLVAVEPAVRWRMIRDFVELVAPDAAARVGVKKLFELASDLAEYPDRLLVFELGSGVTLKLSAGGVLTVER